MKPHLIAVVYNRDSESDTDYTTFSGAILIALVTASKKIHKIRLA